MSLKYGIPKGEKKSFTETLMKPIKKNPGAGQYDITKADRVITIGARRGYK